MNITRHAGLLMVCLSLVAACGQSAESMPDFRLPAGFKIEELVTGVTNARSMTWGDAGTLFVATRQAGKVYAVRGALSGKPEILTIAEKLSMPNGVAFRDGSLYVAEPRRLLVLPAIETRLEDPPAPVAVGEELPYKGALHSWKYIAFGPDGRLYVPIGAPCNVCDAPGFGLIMRMQPDGSQREVVARGVRNSVGFDWDPSSGDLWFTDNGRDMLGDEVPACELNHATGLNQDFGFPYCHGGDVADPEFGKLGRCSDAQPPAQRLAPHAAPLGMKFYTGSMFPAQYRGQVFIAEHGSWNRSKEAGKTGYRVSLVRLEKGRPVGYETFLEGFLEGDRVLGRPVDILLAPDGSMLVSDDQRGVIYRVSYTGGA